MMKQMRKLKLSESAKKHMEIMKLLVRAREAMKELKFPDVMKRSDVRDDQRKSLKELRKILLKANRRSEEELQNLFRRCYKLLVENRQHKRMELCDAPDGTYVFGKYGLGQLKRWHDRAEPMEHGDFLGLNKQEKRKIISAVRALKPDVADGLQKMDNLWCSARFDNWLRLNLEQDLPVLNEDYYDDLSTVKGIEIHKATMDVRMRLHCGSNLLDEVDIFYMAYSGKEVRVHPVILLLDLEEIVKWCKMQEQGVFERVYRGLQEEFKGLLLLAEA